MSTPRIATAGRSEAGGGLADRAKRGATLALTGKAAPAQGFILRLPRSLKAEVKVGGKTLKAVGDGDFLLPLGTQEAAVGFAPGR